MKLTMAKLLEDLQESKSQYMALYDELEGTCFNINI
jgi:hypothetical protein